MREQRRDLQAETESQDQTRATEQLDGTAWSSLWEATHNTSEESSRGKRQRDECQADRERRKRNDHAEG